MADASPAQLADGREPAGDRQHLGRGRSAAARRGVPRRAAGRTMRRAWRMCVSPCWRSATAPMRASARPAGRSTRGWRRWAPRGSPRGSIATWIIRSRRQPGSMPRCVRSPRPQDPGAAVIHVDFVRPVAAEDRARVVRRRDHRRRSTSTAAAPTSRRIMSSCRWPDRGIDLRTRRFARLRAAQRSRAGGRRAARRRPGRRCGAARGADRTFRHHHADARPDRRLRRADRRRDDCARWRRTRRAWRSSCRTGSSSICWQRRRTG